MPLQLEQIISGGQTGVDQAALVVAHALGLRTGGYAPKGWRTDAGPAPWLGTTYGLVEDPSSGYRNRTIANVRAADLTVWFGDVTSPGGQQTKRAAFDRPWLENPTPEILRYYLHQHPVRVMNVAGNRLRSNPHAAVTARTTLWLAIRGND